MTEETTQNDTEARPSEVRSTSLLADAGDACSLYDKNCLRIESWCETRGRWMPESNWGEHEIDGAVRQLKMLNKYATSPNRLIRMRFEIVTANH